MTEHKPAYQTLQPQPAKRAWGSSSLASPERASVSSDRSAQRGSRSVGSGEDTDGEGVRLARSAAHFRRAKAHRPAGGAEPQGRPIRWVVAGLHRPNHHAIIEPI